MKNNLLSNPREPLNRTDYESNLVFNSINGASRETAMKIKHRILELKRLNAKPIDILRDILREINLELKND